MRFEASMTLEDQIKLLATELERTRSELRALQRQHRRSALSTRLFYLSGLIVIGSLLGIAFSSPGAAQQEVARPTIGCAAGCRNLTRSSCSGINDTVMKIHYAVLGFIGGDNSSCERS